ncbi:MAG: CRISPR-associated endonuclease Cas2 [bacterium]
MIIICYDFSNDKVRTQFSTFLKKYGHAVQYSVYAISNSKRVLKNILAEIECTYKKKIKNTDHVLIFQVCEQCQKKIIRFGRASHEVEDIIYFE